MEGGEPLDSGVSLPQLGEDFDGDRRAAARAREANDQPHREALIGDVNQLAGGA